ncbi:MAG: hypothetical protein K9G40_00200 [Crocinitomicaceae bacterium]|jgi:hypothetical protein|nr:hypothetical protein [Crocinitomicaceae bacterium]MCF8434367.1 hypothetical protein [Crocinitomicaceae bacterium]
MTFFEKYSYKKKNYALLVLIILLLAVVYKRSIKTTLEIKKYSNELNAKLDKAKFATTDIRLKQQQISKLNDYLGQENNSVEKVQQGFLNFFARNSSRLIVYQIDEVLTFKHPDFSIKTHRIVLKGGFINSLKFIHLLEKDFDLARLINVTFKYQKNPNDDKESLYTTLILQNYLR